MEKKYKIQILICVVIIVCLIASGYIAPYFMYDQNDVAAVYRLIAENNLDYPKYQPSKWDFVNWAQRENEPLKAHGIHFHSDLSIPVADLSQLDNMEYFWDESGTVETLLLPASAKTVRCRQGILKTLDCSRATALESLRCDGNQLTELDLSNAKMLDSLDCSDNQLTMLNITGLDALEEVKCEGNRLETLDLTGVSGLVRLDCDDNLLKELNCSEKKKLSEIECSNNQITELHLDGASNLKDLRCENNQLTKLRMADLPKLEYVRCAENPFKQVIVDNLPSLEYLNCSKERGRIVLYGGMKLISFDYPSRIVTVKAEPPAGKYLGGITGLPEGTEIVDDTATFQLTWSVVDLTPRYWDDSLK